MKERAPRNRTLTCSQEEIDRFAKDLLRLNSSVTELDIEGHLVLGDFFDVVPYLPRDFVDLLILDPPYNLSKDYNGNLFKKKSRKEYQNWFYELLLLLKPMMKSESTLYVCSDWKTSSIIQPILGSLFCVQNRITWEREKGRGAKSNWKNNTEDIWFCTKSEKYYFDCDSVKVKRKVLAPYREGGLPKDWKEEKEGNFRLTHASNIWTDITVPFWSMPENTDHPTQKPEKLIAKLVLASSKENQFVFDPFLGSGTSAVVAQKLGRKWSGVELNCEYLCWAQKRLINSRNDKSIQGYAEDVFWERNTLSFSSKTKSYSDELIFP